MLPSLTEWLEEDHLAWFVLDAVEQMDLSAFHAGYRADGWGRAAHDPKMMVALTLYAYCTGIRSSRAIERACRVDVAFRVVAANQAPDHTTIARFRARHEQALASVITESLRLCGQAEMVKVGLVAVDGTKMGCPAALAANRSKDHLDEQVATMLAEAAQVDAAEDARYGTGSRGNEPPAQLRGAMPAGSGSPPPRHNWTPPRPRRRRPAHEQHLAERAAREQASDKKLRGRKPKAPVPAGEAKANTSDPESQIMKTKDGYVQGYNAQAVATEDQIVVAAEVTDVHNDHARLHPMIAATNRSLAEAGIAEAVDRLLADAGYCSENNLAALTDQDPDCFIATRNQRRNPQPRNGRRGPLPAAATLVDKMDRKVSIKAGRAVYRKRQHIIEPVFGQIKDARGARRFMRRGKAAAASEWKLLMGTHNLLKLYRQTLTDPTAPPWTPRAGAPAIC
ncbi:transposase [Nocardioides sp. CF8]|uniref:transposase n=1 Tax=Nocardioides sp. CF8 TaxID=110319 RepID=UPI0018DB96EB|nr:transposase [Nocardioides sp. CF8]